MSKGSFVKISRSIGFNRYRLECWKFTSDTVLLTFESGKEITLTGAECETFRNWVEKEAEPAPETYQHTLFDRPQVTQDLGQIPKQQRGK